jgi:hypothetical protein
MVTPYLSRLRPAERGPGLQPRARSRFEPGRTFPLDGPSIGSLGPGPGVGLSAAADAEPAGVEVELGLAPSDQGPPAQSPPAQSPPAQSPPAQSPPAQSPPGQPLPGQAPYGRTLSGQPLPGRTLPAGAPGDRGLTPGRAEVPERAGPDAERARAADVTAPAGRVPAPPPPAPPVAGLARAAAAGAEHGHGGGDARDFRPPPAVFTGRGHDQAPSGGTRRGSLDQPLLRADGSEAVSATPQDAALGPRVPGWPANRTSGPAQDPAERVQAMARWLRDADPAAARPPAAPAQGPLGGVRPGPDPAPEVTVTIGRIEVKAPAAAPAPAAASAGGTRRRVPSLDDYLESRTRARGRPV